MSLSKLLHFPPSTLCWWLLNLCPTHIFLQSGPASYFQPSSLWLNLDMTRTHNNDSKRNHIINYNMSRKVGSLHSILKVWLSINSVGLIRELHRNAASQGLYRTYWIMIYILTWSLGYFPTPYNLRSPGSDCMNFRVWQFSIYFLVLWLTDYKTMSK